jgi:hypothetical protein
MSHKNDALPIFIKFQKYVERYFNLQIKSIQSDWGGEYRSLSTYFANCGISHRVSCPHTHQQNGAVERKHRHIVETGLALLYHASIPLRFWDDAFQTACYLINRLPQTLLKNISPFEKLFHTAPEYNFLKTFGCACWLNLRPYNSHKLQPRSTQCVFLGYSISHKGYKCFHIPTGRTYISRDVIFLETQFPFQQVPNPVSQSTPSLLGPPVGLLQLPSLGPHNTATSPVRPLTDSRCSPRPSSHNPAHNPSLNSLPVNPSSLPELDPTVTPEHPTTTSENSTFFTVNSNNPETSSTTDPPHPPPPIHPMKTRSQNQISKPKTYTDGTIRYPIPKALLAETHNDADLTEPTCHTFASKSPHWRRAMNLEFDALLKNHTWTLVPSSSAQNLIGCKWVFRIKRHADGFIERFKARLVAKGFHQQPGIDYGETYSPVIKPTTVRAILSIAISAGWSIRQIDIQNAFLHGQLSEDVFMAQPPGYQHPSYPSHVCKLNKAIYGLKQAPRAWFSRLSSRLLQLGFHGSLSDMSLFIYKSQSFTMFILIYVDDIIITCSNKSEIDKLLCLLESDFAVKDLGKLNYFLGVEVIPNAHGILLSQQRYIINLLKRTNMHEAKPVSSLMASTTSLTAHEGESFADVTLFRSTVGALQYLSLTRPDIAFAVNKLSQFMHKPTVLHWQSAKRLLRYLKQTLTFGLQIYRTSCNTLQAFSDADWAGSRDDRHSTGSFCIFLGNNLISWSCRK